jgi:formyl-CoA transferase
VPYQLFDAADKPLIIAVGNDRQFRKLAELCGHPEWAKDERFATNSSRVANRTEIVGLIADSIRQKNADEWFDLLEVAGIPAGPINSISEALADVQTQHRQTVRSIAGVPQVGSPVRLDGACADADLPPPGLGEHTSEVLGRLGLDPDEIERLRTAKVIA